MTAQTHKQVTTQPSSDLNSTGSNGSALKTMGSKITGSKTTGSKTTEPSKTVAEGLFTPVRPKLISAFLGAVISGLLSAIPAIAAVEIRRIAIPKTYPFSSGHETIDSRSVWTWVVIAAICLVASQLTFFGNGLLTHRADLRLGDSVRRRIVRTMRELPLGWFDRRAE